MPGTDTLSINFAATYSLRYAKIVGEPEFHSTTLGTFSFITTDEETKYLIHKFTFKIKESEHKVIVDTSKDDGDKEVPKTMIGEL